MKNKLVIVIALLGWFACANSFAVPVSVAFHLNIQSIMEQFFQQNPLLIIDRYSDINGVEHPLPSPLSISFDPIGGFGTGATPVLDLGNANRGQSFSIRLFGRYFLRSRIDGAPAVAIPFRIRYDLSLHARTTQRDYIHQENVRVANEGGMHPPEADQTRARNPTLLPTYPIYGETPVGGTLIANFRFLATEATLAPMLFNNLL
jgi:hypothetical protein